MSQTEFAGTLYLTIARAANAWAQTALPDVSVIDTDEPSDLVAAELEVYCWGEAQRIGEGAPEDTDETEWRNACRAALHARIDASRVSLTPDETDAIEAAALKAAEPTDAEITDAAQVAFHASHSATGDDGCAFDAANETIRALTSRKGAFDQETLTWTSD